MSQRISLKFSSGTKYQVPKQAVNEVSSVREASSLSAMSDSQYSVGTASKASGITFQYDIESNKIYVVLPSDDKNLLVNRAGRPCWMGPNNKYYCGGNMDTDCECCDGMCGPTKGCSCPDCAALNPKKNSIDPIKGSNQQTSSNHHSQSIMKNTIVPMPDPNEGSLSARFTKERTFDHHKMWEPNVSRSQPESQNGKMQVAISKRKVQEDTSEAHIISPPFENTQKKASRTKEMIIEMSSDREEDLRSDISKQRSSISGVEIFIPNSKLGQDFQDINNGLTHHQLERFLLLQQKQQQQQQQQQQRLL